MPLNINTWLTQLPRERRMKIIYYVLATIAIGFVGLTAFVYFDPLSMIDREFSIEIQEHQNPVLDFTMRLISQPGYMPYSAFTVIGTALLFFVFKYKRESLFILLTGLSGLVSSLVKLLINRPRPQASIVRVIVKTSEASFPSGHVLFYTVFFGFLILLMLRVNTIGRPLRITVALLSLFMILTIPISRIYLGAHWFTDVTAGFLLGMLCLYALGYFYLKKAKAKL